MAHGVLHENDRNTRENARGKHGAYRPHGHLPAVFPTPTPHVLLWGFSPPPQTPAQHFSLSLPVLPSGLPGPCPHQHPKDEGLVPAPLQSSGEVAQAKTWSGVDIHAGLCPIPLALGCPLLEYWPSMQWALTQMSETVTSSELSVEPS